MTTPQANCFLIAHIDTRTGRVVRLQTAGEYPVEQLGLREYQALLAKTEGADFQMALDHMDARLRDDPTLAWVTAGSLQEDEDEDDEDDLPPHLLRRLLVVSIVARALPWRRIVPRVRELAPVLRHPVISHNLMVEAWKAYQRRAPGYDVFNKPLGPIMEDVIEDVLRSPAGEAGALVWGGLSDADRTRFGAFFEQAEAVRDRVLAQLPEDLRARITAP